MTTAEIRQTFLDFFSARDHAVRPSSSLVPSDDPTLLFTNAGMVQFKKVFLGQEETDYARAVTSQKCVRAGGKHNDLEEVGRTRRHHTFFEMLGNFSFGDYFKEGAIRYAWSLVTDAYGLDPERLYVTVHHTDDEADQLWRDVAGVEPARIHRLGDADNFWQMADTGPCGPCAELHYDVRPEPTPIATTDELVALGDDGRLVEIWNLVFMQFDRSEDGVLTPLPAPSIDTGAGLERLAAVLQRVDSSFHIDAFAPLLDRVAEVVGRPYEPDGPEGVGYRVLVDHARAVAFLLADGVYPSSEGRGYVLRRILRRAVRHAWLLGLREPALVHLVEQVIRDMREVYPELEARREHILETTVSEEERFLDTIEGGLQRFDAIAPTAAEGERTTIPGDEVFRLYDTFGFPLDLTRLMARERGYEVDLEGFQAALEEQRERSRADRADGDSDRPDSLGEWTDFDPGAEQEFVGYDTTFVKTEVIGAARSADRVALQLRENPFYVEAGGQVSDRGVVRGEGWRLDVDEVVRVGDRVAVVGDLSGEREAVRASRSVEAEVARRSRRDTERNHTGTHLLHAALRSVLGDHVVQRGSLVAPGRLRFDFAHGGPLTPEQRQAVESRVNEAIFDDLDVRTRVMPYEDAVAWGAMALFGEKYADVVRVVEVPDVSLELCGGTHVRKTGEIGLLKIVGESGVAAGVRRIEAQTGPGAVQYLEDLVSELDEAAAELRTSRDNVANRASQMVAELEELEALLVELRTAGGAGPEVVSEASIPLPSGGAFDYATLRLKARDSKDAREWGDAFREGSNRAALLAAEMPDGKRTLFAFVTDDLISHGLRADAIVRQVAEVAGGRGGGRPHMAQAGVSADRVDEALSAAEGIVRALAGKAS